MARPKKGAELGATKTIGIRLPPTLRASIEVSAERHGRSLTDEIRAALEDYVKRLAAKAKKAKAA